MPIGIIDIEYYLPQRTISAEELASKFDFSTKFVTEKLGIKKLYLVAEEELTSDMATEAAQKILNKHPHLKDKIGVLIVCTQTPDYQLPHTSAIVQNKLNLKKSVACFDISLGCSGFVYGLSIIEAFLKENHLEYGLLITSENYSKNINDKDKNTKPLFSDAAAATLIGKNPVFISNQFSFGTYGKCYDHLIIRRNQSPWLEKNNYIEMNGRGIYNFALSEIPNDIEHCLSLNETKIEEIDYFVFHQASKFMLDALSKKMKLDNTKVLMSIDLFGNTVSSTIPIALKTFFKGQGEVRPLKKFLLSGFGVGLSWASTVLTFQGDFDNERRISE